MRQPDVLPQSPCRSAINCLNATASACYRIAELRPRVPPEHLHPEEPPLSANLPRSSLPLISRRTVLAGLGLAAASLTFAAWPVFAERKDGPAEVPVDELMKSGAGDLPDLVLGPADAKVTVVEYASMTCGHCAAFATKVFPELKTKYIDSGKIRFVMREFPLDN